MLYIFGGEDSFSRKAAVSELKKKMNGGDMASLNTVVFEGAKLTADQLMAACNSAPFFSDRRLVIVTGLLVRFETRDQKAPKTRLQRGVSKGTEAWRTYANCLANLAPTVDVVLEEDAVGRTNALLKELATVAEVRWFVPLRPAELLAWVDKRVRDGKGTIATSAARLLAESVGNNLWVLAAEVEKLLVYRGPERITDEDVRLLVSYARDANVFAMVDALVERRASNALHHIHQLIDQGATLPYLVVMITRQFRLLIQAKEMALQRARPSDIRRILGISSDFVFEKTMKQIGGYSLGQLEEIYHLLLQVDMEVKTGKVDQEVALDLLVLDLCRALPVRAGR